jgi:hypothetical protein
LSTSKAIEELRIISRDFVTPDEEPVEALVHSVEAVANTVGKRLDVLDAKQRGRNPPRK